MLILGGTKHGNISDHKEIMQTQYSTRRAEINLPSIHYEYLGHKPSFPTYTKLACRILLDNSTVQFKLKRRL